MALMTCVGRVQSTHSGVLVRQRSNQQQQQQRSCMVVEYGLAACYVCSMLYWFGCIFAENAQNAEGIVAATEDVSVKQMH